MAKLNGNAKIPKWLWFIGFVAVPVTVAVIQSWDKLFPQGIDKPETIECYGTAYYENGEVPIQSRPVKLTQPTTSQEATMSDGSFLFSVSAESIHTQQIAIAAQPVQGGEWVTVRRALPAPTNSGKIDLGRIYFPVPAPKSEQENKTPPQKSIEKNRQNVHPQKTERTKPSSPHYHDVTVKYPAGAQPVSISIFPQNKSAIREHSSSCTVSVLPGQYELSLHTPNGQWKAKFTHEDGFVPDHRFAFKRY